MSVAPKNIMRPTTEAPNLCATSIYMGMEEPVVLGVEPIDAAVVIGESANRTWKAQSQPGPGQRKALKICVFQGVLEKQKRSKRR